MPLKEIADVATGMVLFLIAGSIHEFAHAYSAYLRGDSTARNAGRMTINPLVHVDLFGTIIFPLFAAFSHLPLLGWMKGVPVNPYNLKNPGKDQALVSFAGPLSNFLQAAAGLLLLRFFIFLEAVTGAGFLELLQDLFFRYISLNLLLMVFNLLPVPPLDGGWILRYALPTNMKPVYDQVYRYGFLILYILSFTGILSSILWPLISFFSFGVSYLLYSNLIFSFLPLLAGAGIVYFFFREDLKVGIKKGEFQAKVKKGESFLDARLRQIMDHNRQLYKTYAPLLEKLKNGKPLTPGEEKKVARLEETDAYQSCCNSSFDPAAEECLRCATYPHCLRLLFREFKA